MPRIMIKGVIWNKAQDNIVKAGVLRYGENQWKRIIRLLPGKTVKQCKDRWEIGLKRSTKKTEWTQNEDDELLHLAIAMHTKWQNIASIIGRSAVDCFNRYDYLSNRAQKIKEDDAAVEPRMRDPERISRIPGAHLRYIYVDGLEVLMSEARAKLANSQAKRARLLAREKRLEITRRFAKVRRLRERVRAKIRAEEMCKKTLNLDSENSSNCQSDSFYRFSSEGFVDPLADIFLEMQQRTKKEEIDRAQNEGTNERPNRNDHSAEKFSSEDQPPTKRRKVLVVREPNIAYEDLQQVVELGKHFESELTGR